MQKHYESEHKFNGVYSRNDLSKIKNGVHVINLNEYEPIGTYWMALYVNANNMVYFDSWTYFKRN